MPEPEGHNYWSQSVWCPATPVGLELSQNLTRERGTGRGISPSVEKTGVVPEGSPSWYAWIDMHEGFKGNGSLTLESRKHPVDVEEWKFLKLCQKPEDRRKKKKEKKPRTWSTAAAMAFFKFIVWWEKTLQARRVRVEMPRNFKKEHVQIRFLAGDPFASLKVFSWAFFKVLYKVVRMCWTNQLHILNLGIINA